MGDLEAMLDSSETILVRWIIAVILDLCQRKLTATIPSVYDQYPIDSFQ
jgi:hypothetical protein